MSTFVCAGFTTSHLSPFYHTTIQARFLPRRVKLEVTDNDGTTYSFSLHGRFSQDKVMRMVELLDLLEQGNQHDANPSYNESTIYGRIFKLIQSAYPLKDFSSADIARDYEDTHSTRIPLSTVSTYLSRLADKGILSRQKFGNSWVYHHHHVPNSQLAK